MSTPAFLKQGSDANGLFGGNALVSHPVIGRNSHRDRLVAGPFLAHGMEHFQRPPHAVFQAAAIFVVAMVGQRRDEGRQQIAMGHVQFDHVEASALRHRRGGHEFIANPVHIAGVSSGAARHCVRTKRPAMAT